MIDFEFVKSVYVIDCMLSDGMREPITATHYLLRVYKSSQQDVDDSLAIDYSRADRDMMNKATKYIFDCYHKFLTDEEVIEFKTWLADVYRHNKNELKWIVREMERFNPHLPFD